MAEPMEEVAASSGDSMTVSRADELAHLLAHNPAVLYRLNWGATIRFSLVSENVLALTGFPATRFEGEVGFWRTRVHPDDRLPRGAFRRQLELDGRLVQEYRFQRADGEWRWFHDETTFASRSDGSLSLIGSIMDVSERRSLQLQLSQALRLEAIGSLAAGIAHEINTPAQFASDNVHFLGQAFEQFLRVIAADRAALADPAVPPAVRAAADAVHASGDLEFLCAEVPLALDQAADGLRRIARIVQAVKRFAHPLSDTEEPVELAPLLDAAVDVTRNEWKYCAELVVEVIDPLPIILASPGELQQVFLNLIVNAAHAIVDRRAISGERAAGRIHVRAEQADATHVEIRVADTGCGIPDSVRHRIFEPFFTTKEVGRGSGHGLALVWSVVVEQHRGRVDLESEVGVGTTFIVRLPIAGRTRCV